MCMAKITMLFTDLHTQMLRKVEVDKMTRHNCRLRWSMSPENVMTGDTQVSLHILADC